MHCIVIGSPDIGDYDKITSTLDKVLSQCNNITMVVPELFNQGTEKLAMLYAKEMDLELVTHCPLDGESVPDTVRRVIEEYNETSEKIGMVAFHIGGDNLGVLQACSVAKEFNVPYKIINI